MTNYRKIYKEYHGSIPVDEEGRTYDIHHIDGDRTNNNIQNLIAISIKEHYKLHLEKNEYRAAHAILLRMNKTSEEISRLSSLGQKQLVQEGRHHFQDKEKTRKYQKQLVQEGKHHWCTTEHSNMVRSKNLQLASMGMHIFQSENSRKRISDWNKKAIDSGTHPFLNGVGGKSSRDRVKNKTHHLMDKSLIPKRIEKTKEKNSYIVYRSDGIVYIGLSDATKDMNGIRERLEKAIKNNTEYCGYFWKILGKGLCSTTIPQGSTIKRLETQNIYKDDDIV